MATTPLSLKIIESSSVAPPLGTTPHRITLPFTYFDVIYIFWAPVVERLFFYHYPHSTSHFLSSFLPSLKSSLSLALKTYYPLAGGFRRTPGTDNKFEHYYVEGDAVSFIVAEYNGQFEDLASDHERDIGQLDCLVPKISKSDELQPLFAVQVTVFPEKGIVIGTSVHHTACDGNASMQFTHAWAELCLSGASVSSRVPIFDRTLISDPSDHYNLFYNLGHKLLKYTPKDYMLANKPSDLIYCTFRLGQEEIKLLKQLVLVKAKEKGTLFHCSTIVVTYAYAWTGFVRAKCIDNSKTVRLVIPANFRARLQPPLPMEYFGNCVHICMAEAKVTDLIQEDGFIRAAETVGKAIDQLREGFKAPNSQSDELGSGIPVLSIAGSPKFKVYDVDFGIGRPTKVEVVSALKIGTMTVADSRDEEGGVEIGIAFPKEEMGCFKKYFFDGLELLSK